MTVTELERAVKAEERLSKGLRKYRGEWVAVRNHKVVAHARKLSELMQELGSEAESVDVRRISSREHTISIL